MLSRSMDEKKKAPKQEHSHAGHRSRLREKYLAGGMDAMEAAEILELLLCYAIPRRDTSGLARRLLRQYGTIGGVLNAPLEALQQVEGLGEQSALLLTLAGQLGQKLYPRYNWMHMVEATGKFLLPLFAGRRDETVIVLTLDIRGRILQIRDLGKGTPISVAFSLRDILDAALQDQAVGLVVSHNHINAVALPSKEDVVSTRQLYHALAMIRVDLVDHIIVAGDDFVSMRESGYFAKF